MRLGRLEQKIDNVHKRVRNLTRKDFSTFEPDQKWTKIIKQIGKALGKYKPRDVMKLTLYATHMEIVTIDEMNVPKRRKK